MEVSASPNTDGQRRDKNMILISRLHLVKNYFEFSATSGKTFPLSTTTEDCPIGKVVSARESTPKLISVLAEH